MKSIKRYEGINVVPFIDVLLVLLAIVFVISNFIALGKIDVKLPTSSTKEAIKDVKHNIVITENSELYVNDALVDREEFKRRLFEFSKDDVITIVSDKKALYEDFIFVVDVLKERGLEKISMATKR
ncbi:Biopolymer transport protein ExbD/TolR [Sulfurimonas denitrificans DSM 1251]|uniref:Biopolymer transport protein ExbD/TolR n=1 Tax=Sulfurimonas denitrificans (strain ATCC 33889 / DSM 1251) TaxID=326298 RepID=Q30RV0_SULDN|nr:biopolymer transporter ExbD [Sulfurimonas denitrificans]ABB44281.1 Biopolymer transport protein ExbD/TolR [Sulfurimonas denitrificans DSM 1251]MDD3443115.1 biopolymer transporter ExbD [Sulfurimonas denitrificans]